MPLRFKLLLTLILALPATGLLADDTPEVNTQITESCLLRGDGAACVMRAAEACLAAPGNATTYAASQCLQGELVWWEARLGDVYPRLLERQRAQDAEFRQSDARPWPDPESGPGETALRETQAAWLAWRDLACGFEAVQWWGGSGAGGAQLVCLLRLTAEQALRLEDYLTQS